jgi:hypothetical protein
MTIDNIFKEETKSVLHIRKNPSTMKRVREEFKEQQHQQQQQKSQINILKRRSINMNFTLNCCYYY